MLSTSAILKYRNARASYDRYHDFLAFDPGEPKQDRCRCWGCTADDVGKSAWHILRALESAQPDQITNALLLELRENVYHFSAAIQERYSWRMEC